MPINRWWWRLSSSTQHKIALTQWSKFLVQMQTARTFPKQSLKPNFENKDKTEEPVTQCNLIIIMFRWIILSMHISMGDIIQIWWIWPAWASMSIIIMKVHQRLGIWQRLVEEENQRLIVMLIHSTRLKERTTETNLAMVVDRLVEWMPVLSNIIKIT